MRDREGLLGELGKKDGGGLRKNISVTWKHRPTDRSFAREAESERLRRSIHSVPGPTQSAFHAQLPRILVITREAFHR